MLFQAFYKPFLLQLGCLGSISLLSLMSSSSALSQSTSPVTSGTYILNCRSNTTSGKTLYDYRVEGVEGFSFFNKQIFFVDEKNVIAQDYVPFFYPSNLISGGAKSPERKFTPARIVGSLSTIYFAPGSKTPRLRTAFVDLSSNTCKPLTSDDVPDRPALEVSSDGVGYEANLLEGQKVTLPDGSVLEASDDLTSITETKPNGLKLQISFDEDDQVSVLQYFSPDGRKLEKGEELTLPDGTKVKQP
jgi:hypothetical protein